MLIEHLRQRKELFALLLPLFAVLAWWQRSGVEGVVVAGSAAVLAFVAIALLARDRAAPLLLLPFCVALCWMQLRSFGYIKDDTFIALRYARNLALGEGMVFNLGQRIEGYTDFLWVVLSAPAFWTDIDPVMWVKGLACFFGQLGLLVIWELGRHFDRDRISPALLFGLTIWTFSGTVSLWSMAGMEGTLMSVLCSGGTLMLLLLWYRSDDSGPAVWQGVVAGLLVAGAALCRPEGHAFVLLAAGLGLADAARRGRIPRPWLACAGVLLVTLGPYHLWRYLYFGGLVPNTYLAKASTGWTLIEDGKDFVKGLLTHEANPAVFALAALALVSCRRFFARLVGVGLCLFFMLYMLKVGTDEMKWFRLYLPVYPLAIALSAVGLGGLLRFVLRPLERVSMSPLAVHLATGVLVVAAAAPCAYVSEAHFKGTDRPETDRVERDGWMERKHSRYLPDSIASFQAMGRYIRERSEPGEVVVFQDMGAAPYAAPDLRWVDTIGILDKNVARELSQTGVNPFARGVKKRSGPLVRDPRESCANLPTHMIDRRCMIRQGALELHQMDKRLRDYFLAQDPSWIAFVAYTSRTRGKTKRRYLAAQGDPEAEAAIFEPRIKQNAHSHYLARDGRFQRNFHYVRAWPRNRYGYILVLYRANDHVDARDRRAD